MLYVIAKVLYFMYFIFYVIAKVLYFMYFIF